MRTPLSIIKTNAEIFLLDEDLDPKVRKTVKSDIEELSRMSEIINNLLSLNTLVRPAPVNFQATNMSLVVDSALKKLSDFAKSKEIEVAVVKKNHEYIVWGNYTALEQIAINLLKNAISYTPNRGKIEALLDLGYEDSVIFSVTDTGIGISAKDLPHIFEPFYRAERSRNRRSGSTGLGLAIVNELIKLHSATIRVYSAVNEGTTVKVSFPPHTEKKEKQSEQSPHHDAYSSLRV